MRRKKWKKEQIPKTISFEEEIISKPTAQKILEENPKSPKGDNDPGKSQTEKKLSKKNGKAVNMNENKSSTSSPKRKKKGKMKTSNEEVEEHVNSPQEETTEEASTPKSKKRKLSKAEPEPNESEEGTSEKVESIRARKRKRHAQLVEEKKLKSELALQHKALNYLSKWKHCRDEWKFAKLIQVWLQHNMYDASKVPEDFWEVLVEYFSNSKGQARDVMLKEALKIIEDCSEDESGNEIRINRARDIIQNLQE